MMAVGLVLSFQDFTLPSTPYDSQVLHKSLLTIIASFLASSVLILLLLKFMPGIPIFNRLILKTSESPAYGFNQNIVNPYERLVGKKGIVSTSLHPTGYIEIDNDIYDVVTLGDFVEKGQIVKVINVEGNRIVVGPA